MNYLELGDIILNSNDNSSIKILEIKKNKILISYFLNDDGIQQNLFYNSYIYDEKNNKFNILIKNNLIKNFFKYKIIRSKL